MLKVVIVLLILVCSSNTFAYKESTHRDLSENAVNISNLSEDASLLVDFGLQPYSNKEKFTNPRDPAGEKLTIEELVGRGAFFEDDNLRAFNHFYNPVNNTPLTIGFKEAGLMSPDWALEDISEVDLNISEPQEYSYRDANHYFFLALTSTTDEDREQNWGKLFQTLGYVIHHVQDMAQPDHVRNDQHNDVTDSSWYEKYTDELRDDNDPIFIGLMEGNSYPIPSFSTAREFWTTQSTDSAIEDRRGIADFTNRNFVSKDTIFLYNNNSLVPSPQHPLPTPNITPNPVNIADPSIRGEQGQAICDQIKALSLITFPSTGCFIDFISTSVTGTVAGENTTNDRAASYSIFDKKLTDHNVDSIYTHEDGSFDTIDRSFTLNEFNFKEAHQYLIPRAVAYSAGLINHFFKAKFEVTVDHINKQFVIKNLSGSVMYGQFQLYVDSLDTGVRSLNQNWEIGDYAASGLANNAVINIPVPDLTMYSSNLMFIYRGQLGNSIGSDHVYAKNINLSSRGGGVFSYIYNPTTEILEIEINSYIYSNLKLDHFNTKIKQIYEGYPDTYEIPNYHWQIHPGGVSFYCVVEAIGDWAGDSPFDSNDFLQIYLDSSWRGLESEDYSFPWLSTEILGLVAPSKTDCTNAPYGYRSLAWSDGWISKYSDVDNVVDLYLKVESNQGAGNIVALPLQNLMVLDNNVCRIATIQDIRNSWTPTGDVYGSNVDYTHLYTDVNNLIIDDPVSYLNTYIPQNILDFSCQ